MPDNVELVGVDAAMRDLDRWASQLGPEVDHDARAFAADLGEQVRGDVPVLTGTLASSVDIVEAEQGEHGAGVSLGDGVPYAGWIEFGGSHGRTYVPEGRYLYPDALAATDEWRRLAEETADQTARRFPWSTPSSL